MKAYIGSVDWADEGDVFFFSIESEDRLKSAASIIELFLKYSILEMNEGIGLHWRSNKYFSFETSDFLHFIDNAKDISEEEIAVFEKFNVGGFDIYELIIEELKNIFYDTFIDVYKDEMTQEDQLCIEHSFVNLFSQEEWNRLMM